MCSVLTITLGNLPIWMIQEIINNNENVFRYLLQNGENSNFTMVIAFFTMNENELGFKPFQALFENAESLIISHSLHLSVSELMSMYQSECITCGGSESEILGVLGITGQDWMYDEQYWNNSILTFPSQELPSYQDFFEGFPKDDEGNWLYGAHNIYPLVGGAVLEVYETYPIAQTQNVCALKVSIALVHAGINIPNITGSTLEGADGNFYFLNARALTNWMKITFPEFDSYPSSEFFDPNAPNQINVQSVLGNNTGIIISDYEGLPGNISGHADIYTGERCSGSGHCSVGGTVHFWNLD